MVDMSQCNSGSTLEDVSSCGKRLIGGSKKKVLRKCRFEYYGRPVEVMTDPEGCIQDKHCRVWSACEDVKWDAQQEEAAWRTGVLDKGFDVIKNSAT